MLAKMGDEMPGFFPNHHRKVEGVNAGNDDERNRVNDHHENHGTDRTHEILHDFVSDAISD